MGCRRALRTNLERLAMVGEAQNFVDGVQTCFADFKDPRLVASCNHLLIHILAIMILAVASGAEDWTDLEVFGRLRNKWLGTFLQLPNGIPSHDTFRRVFG